MEAPTTLEVPVALRTLLIVEDQCSVRSTLQFLFEETGYAVLAAESGAAALALLAAHEIDGALIDLHMPGMDGTQVCRRVLADAAASGRPVRVWLMTASYSREAERRTADAGALALLKKPFDWPTLRGAIEAGFAGPACVATPPAESAL